MKILIALLILASNASVLIAEPAKRTDRQTVREAEPMYREFLQARIGSITVTGQPVHAVIHLIFRKANEKVAHEDSYEISAKNSSKPSQISLKMKHALAGDALLEVCRQAGWSFRMRRGRFEFTDSRRYFEEP